MKCCYKMVDADGNFAGVEGIYDHEVEDYFDTTHNVWFIAITYEEYCALCMEHGIEPK